MARIPVDVAETIRMVAEGSREPFQALLVHHLQIEPTVEAMQTFADKYPDRWAQALTMYAKMSGISEAPTLSVSIVGKLRELSDAQLGQLHAEMLLKLSSLEQRSLPLSQAALPIEVETPSSSGCPVSKLT